MHRDFHSRLRVLEGQRVRNAVHQLVYRVAADMGEILAITGDSYPAGRI
jgi:hypothetical protein